MGERFFTNPSQLVKINGASSEPVNVTSGVLQDSVLGPSLFLIYINDLPDTIAGIMKLFADDAKVYRSISTVKIVHEVQNSVNQSESWADIWEMLFNLKMLTFAYWCSTTASHIHNEIRSRTI